MYKHAILAGVVIAILLMIGIVGGLKEPSPDLLDVIM